MPTPDSTKVPASQSGESARVRLFIKPFCGWCLQAMGWLDEHGVRYEALDVTRDPRAWDEMVALSGQTLAPVIQVGSKVLADFGAAELADWWTLHGATTGPAAQ